MAYTRILYGIGRSAAQPATISAITVDCEQPHQPPVTWTRRASKRWHTPLPHGQAWVKQYQPGGDWWLTYHAPETSGVICLLGYLADVQHVLGMATGYLQGQRVFTERTVV